MLGSGLLFALAGAGVFLTLPLPIVVTVPAAILWLCVSVASCIGLRRKYGRIAGYRLYADGSAEIVRADGRRIVGRIAPGTFLLPRLAWLRVSTPGSGRVAELISGDARAGQQWRRFQVICRHLAAC